MGSDKSVELDGHVFSPQMLSALVLAARQIVRPAWAALILPLCVPVVMAGAYGQSIFFAGAALVAGLALIERRPWLAGVLIAVAVCLKPQVAILGTGTVVKRPVVVEDPTLGEVIAVRSIVYLALTYDHRLVDGADAARFLGTVKNRLEEGSFEAELGL